MDEPMPVEEASLTPSTSDNFTDAQHNKQDEEVTLAVKDVFDGRQVLTLGECAILLQVIIELSEDRLQVAFTNGMKAIKLIGENPKLESALQKAWKSKGYKEIRESGELWASSLAGS